MRLLLLATLVGLASVLGDDVFTADDRSRVETILKASSGAQESIDDVHYRLAASQALGQKLARGDLCKMKKVEDVSSVYHQVKVAELLDCPDAPSNSKSVIQEALQADRLVDVYFATQAAASLIQRKKLTADKLDFSNVVPTLRELQNADGTFAGKAGRKHASRQNAGLAMQIVKSIFDNVPKEKQAAKELADLMKQKLGDLFDLALPRKASSSGQVRPLEFVDKAGSNLVSTAAVLQGVIDLSSVVKDTKIVSQTDMKGFALFFVKNKYVATTKAAYYLLTSLRTLADNAVSVPLMLRIANDKPLLSNPSEGETPSRQTVKVKLTDVFDEFSSAATVKLVKGVKGGKANRVTINENLALKVADKGAKNTIYQADFMAGVPAGEFGVFLSTFEITPTSKDAKKGEPSTVVLPVRVSAHLSDLKFEIYSYLVSDGPSSVSDSAKLSVKHPDTTEMVTLDPTHHVQMAIRLKSPFDPKEVLVLLQHKDTKATHLFVPTKKTNKYSLRFNINSQEFEEIPGGTYAISVIVGDRNLDNSAYWDVASVFVDSFDEETSTQRDEWSIKEEISWTFPQPEYQPPFVLSLFFSAVVLAPFAILIISLSWLGAFNIKLPTRAYTASILFQLFSVAVALWFVVYWTSLNVFVAAQGLLFLGFFLFVTGYYALKSRAYFRVQSRRKED